MSDQLSSYLLDPSIVDYTTAVVLESLRDRDHGTKSKRASLALAFFENILDPSKEVEKAQLDIFSGYRAALGDTNPAKSILEIRPDPPARSHTQPLEYDLNPVQRVLTLPELLSVIFSHITVPTKSTRNTLRAASLASVSMRHASQPRLWSRPRDLNTVEQQVRFAFGITISPALGEGAGVHVRRLRIRVMPSTWNVRLVIKITELCPSIVDLTIHWGDTGDPIQKVTSDSVQWLSRTLAPLPKLRYLVLTQFLCADTVDETPFSIPEDAHLPFSKLKKFRIVGFSWYFDAIQRGLGSTLTSLDIGYGDSMFEDLEIASIARKLPRLTSLRFRGALEYSELRLFVETAPGLESIDLHHFDDRDQAYTEGVYTLITQLQAIKKVSVRAEVGPAQIIQIAKSTWPLESITFRISEFAEEPAVRVALLDLLAAKRTTLRYISEDADFKLLADDQLVGALAAIPNLERIYLTFDSERLTVSDAAVEKLLTQCPHLCLTNSIEALAAGRALYEEKYKEAFEKDDHTDSDIYEEYDEDILAR